jgi:hypothetical protein
MRESRVVALVGRHLCPLPRAAPQPAARMAPYAPPNVGNDPSTGSGQVSVPRAAAAAEMAAPASPPAPSAAVAAQVGEVMAQLAGETFSVALASSELAHCVQAQHAWADCAAAIIAQSPDDMAITLEEVIGCASLSRLHTAKRRAQTLLSREMADGRARHMLTTFRDMGAEGDRDTISAESEQARLRSSGGRGAAA